MSKSEILNINQMLFKEINMLMFKQNIGKNPNLFLDVFTKATSNYEGQSISNETFSITLVFLELCN